MNGKNVFLPLLAFSILTTSVSADNLVDKTKEKAKDYLKNIEIHKDVKLVDISLFDGVNNSVKYAYEVQPSYIKGLYSRVDKLSVNTQLSPLTLLGVNSPLRFNINKNSEIIYVTQHTSQLKAATQIPKVALLHKLPSTAQNAIKNLNVGDFVSLNAELSLVFSAGLAASQGWVTAGASAYYGLKGNYNIRVYRLKNNRLRLQLTALKRKNKGVNAGVSVNPGLEIIGFNLIDKKINDFVKFDLVQIGKAKSNDSLFMVDYVLDLDSPEVQLAYNGLIDSSLDVRKLQNLEAIDPTSSIRNFRRTRTQKEENEYKHLKKLLAANLTAFEDIRKQDASKDRDEMRVRRIFKGQNRSETISKNIKYGLNLVKFEDGKVVSDNHLAVEEPDGKKTNYFFPTRTYIDNEDFLFGYFKENEYHNINALFKESENKKNKEFVSFGYYYTRTDKTFLDQEQDRNFRELKRQVPYNIFLSVPQGDWVRNKTRNKARVTTEIYFNANLFKYLVEKNYSRADLELLILDHFKFLNSKFAGPERTPDVTSRKYCLSDELKKLPRPSVAGRGNEGDYLRGVGRLEGQAVNKYLGYYAGEICLMANELKQIFNENINNEARVQLFLDLDKNKLFREMGLGFVLSLIEPDRKIQSKYFRVKVKWSAEDIKTIDFDSQKYYGNLEKDFERDLYQSILSIQSILNNKSFDLRLVEEIVSQDQ